MRADRTWRWERSGYDERVHAFPADELASFVEAACTHTVPYAKVTRGHAGARCLRCLLIVGDQLVARVAGPPAG
ncbi:hypothetical protein [Actinokineospora sp. NBRC 105648]|uniref:hypothetical protein n=1 Tax=Actinokineospora sp. NBRC 105648 TaxID=3032206 RepID=UPI0024A01B93|nr:hypothetical protein [Actinokineospora sp. NBRC 105648]GLZ37471.1 hypothetical protein Acsp05_10960 [Actinokineospora sp. NBRC 105648]